MSANFIYKARRISGEQVTGSLPADSERAAVERLDRMGLFPIEVKLDPKEESAPQSDDAEAPQGVAALLARFGYRRRIGADVTARLARELADLSAAGVPILKALDALSERGEAQEVIWGAKESKEDKRARGLLRAVRRDVSGGLSLADALERRPELFPEASIGMIRAGETGGFLDEALRRVAGFAEREMLLRRRIRGALAYPVLLCFLGLGAVIFLVSWVVPRFATIYKDLGGALPWPTQVLTGISDFFQHRWYVIVGVALAIAIGAARLMWTEEGRARIDYWLLRIPLLRGVIGLAALARFARTLGTLLASGVPILAALDVARGAAGNREFAARLGEAIAPIREGKDVAGPLEATGLFPPSVIEMISVGQESGSLDKVLERVGDRSDEEVDHALRIFTGVLEPLLVVAVASVVFFVVVAALLPVFTLNTLIK